MIAILIPVSFSFLTVPIAMRDLILAKASLPPTAAKCLSIISAAVRDFVSSKVEDRMLTLTRQKLARRTRQEIRFIVFTFASDSAKNRAICLEDEWNGA